MSVFYECVFYSHLVRMLFLSVLDERFLRAISTIFETEPCPRPPTSNDNNNNDKIVLPKWE